MTVYQPRLILFSICTAAVCATLLMGCGIDDRRSPTSLSTVSTSAVIPDPDKKAGRSSDSEVSVAEVDEFEASDLLDRVIPPCIRYPGSSVDPCQRRETWDLLTSHYIETEWELPQIAPSIEESYMRLDGGLAAFAPQIVVRMIPIPGTTRCAQVDSFGASFSWVESEAPTKMYHYTRCYVDLAINEYIIGSGPARLQIDMGVWPYNYTGERLRAEEAIFARKFEGVEWIAFLAGPDDPANAAWRLYWHLDVQKRDDGEVVVVDYSKNLYDPMSLPEFAAINASRTEATLTDYSAQVKSAHGKYYDMTGGRIGTGVDFYGNPLPYAASEATEAALDDYIGQIKAVEGLEFNVSKPPPVPGENDPNPDGLRINDIIATRVAGGVAIPGGLEGTAAPVSALGDEPTATATVEAAVTPEPAPALEDTPTPETSAKETSGTTTSLARAYDSSHDMRIHFAARGERAARMHFGLP